MIAGVTRAPPAGVHMPQGLSAREWGLGHTWPDRWGLGRTGSTRGAGSAGAVEDAVPEPAGTQEGQPLAGGQLRSRLVNAQATGAREQAVPGAVAIAVTAVTSAWHSLLPAHVDVRGCGARRRCRGGAGRRRGGR